MIQHRHKIETFIDDDENKFNFLFAFSRVIAVHHQKIRVFSIKKCKCTSTKNVLQWTLNLWKWTIERETTECVIIVGAEIEAGGGKMFQKRSHFACKFFFTSCEKFLSFITLAALMRSSAVDKTNKSKFLCCNYTWPNWAILFFGNFANFWFCLPGGIFAKRNRDKKTLKIRCK